MTMNEMHDSFHQVLSALSGDNGWLAQVSGWMVTARLVLKPFSALLVARLTEAIFRVIDTEDAATVEMALQLLRAKAYRWAAFVIDLVASLKLPTAKEFTARLETKTKTQT